MLEEPKRVFRWVNYFCLSAFTLLLACTPVGAVAVVLAFFMWLFVESYGGGYMLRSACTQRALHSTPYTVVAILAQFVRNIFGGLGYFTGPAGVSINGVASYLGSTEGWLAEAVTMAPIPINDLYYISSLIETATRLTKEYQQKTRANWWRDHEAEKVAAELLVVKLNVYILFFLFFRLLLSVPTYVPLVLSLTSDSIIKLISAEISASSTLIVAYEQWLFTTIASEIKMRYRERVNGIDDVLQGRGAELQGIQTESQPQDDGLRQNERIQQLRIQLEEVRNDLQRRDNLLLQNENETRQLGARLHEVRTDLHQRNGDLQLAEVMGQQLRVKLQRVEDDLLRNQESLRQQGDELKNANANLRENTAKIKELNANINDRNKRIEENDIDIEQLTLEKERINEQLKNQEKEVTSLTEESQRVKSEVERLQGELQRKGELGGGEATPMLVRSKPESGGDYSDGYIDSEGSRPPTPTTAGSNREIAATLRPSQLSSSQTLSGDSMDDSALSQPASADRGNLQAGNNVVSVKTERRRSDTRDFTFYGGFFAVQRLRSFDPELISLHGEILTEIAELEKEVLKKRQQIKNFERKTSELFKAPIVKKGNYVSDEKLHRETLPESLASMEKDCLLLERRLLEQRVLLANIERAQHLAIQGLTLETAGYLLRLDVVLSVLRQHCFVTNPIPFELIGSGGEAIFPTLDMAIEQAQKQIVIIPIEIAPIGDLGPHLGVVVMSPDEGGVLAYYFDPFYGTRPPQYLIDKVETIEHMDLSVATMGYFSGSSILRFVQYLLDHEPPLKEKEDSDVALIKYKEGLAKYLNQPRVIAATEQRLADILRKQEGSESCEDVVPDKMKMV
ncbi:MAG: hypothetical protein KAS93_02995 [Gammaproteobacteria bacterium]|nr:hypothetical protein [Gammaproteobacteria bacterium]